jgi:succinate dehydrogenase / fumarate reductase membrane anchor subunit
MNNSSPLKPISGSRPEENSTLWLIKIATGPLLVLVIILHFAVNHYMGSTASGLMTYTDVITYFKNPIVPAVEILFLITVVTHSLIGLRGIFLDLKPSRLSMTVINWVLTLVGVSTIVYGIWLALAIASQGT